MPTPPPITTAVPNRSISEGLPSGPTTSRIASPASSVFSWLVVLPIAWTTMVIVPRRDRSRDGQRDPLAVLVEADDDELPAFRVLAIRGASISNCLTWGAEPLGLDDEKHRAHLSNMSRRKGQVLQRFPGHPVGLLRTEQDTTRVRRNHRPARHTLPNKGLE